MSDDEHTKAHAAALPAYVQNGERPSLLQIITFGATGGLVPCPAAISVMLLALSVSHTGLGLFLVFGFSIGLALTLVGVGLLVVTGVTHLPETGSFAKLSKYIPAVAAALVIFSGAIGLIAAFQH
jgi:nickel/cobalt exporter